MSELKAYKGDIYIPVYGSIADAEVYLKSEADKVIAHHKHKRCVAMAELCDADACYQEMYIMDDKKATWFFNWEYKWRKLAEKFKEDV